MAKRVADKYITDQNWDKEEATDDNDGRGEFKRANIDTLNNRVIRKAKRRTPITGEQVSAFSGFSGLKTPIGSNSDSTPFKGFTTNSSTMLNIAKPPPKGPSLMSSEEDDETSQKTGQYNTHLSALNRSVSNWIKNHVEKNPLCDLSPIFNDYKKHLADIDEKYGQSDTDGSQTSKSAASDTQDIPSPPSSQGLSQPTVSDERPKFSLTGFGEKSASKEVTSSTVVTADEPKVATTKSSFMGFTSNTTSGSPFKGFTGFSKPPPFSGFSFNASMVSTKSEPTSQQSATTGEEEYVPPVPESNIVEEDDAFYSIRCKLYYKKGDSYADRGVGQLYLKPSGTKTQLLIRADTAISQVLLNILLTSAMPIQRQGKNNIIVMCIPNPPIDLKKEDEVVAMLIRVKTAEDADKLFDLMEEKKGEAEDN